MKKISKNIRVLSFIIVMVCFISVFVVNKYYNKTIDDNINKISYVDMNNNLESIKPEPMANSSCNIIIQPLSGEITSEGSLYRFRVVSTGCPSINFRVSNGSVDSYSTTMFLSEVNVKIGSPCTSTVFTAYSGSMQKSYTITDVRYPWRKGRDGAYVEKLPSSAVDANNKEKNIYGKCYERNVLNIKYWNCKDVYERNSCTPGGNPPSPITPPVATPTPTPTPAPKYSYCCVDNELPGLSSNVFYVVDKPQRNCSLYAGEYGKPGGNYTLLDNYGPSQCRAPEAVLSSCNTTNTSVPKQEYASACEGNVSFQTNDNISCTGFYTINCRKTINGGFDYGNDSNNGSSRYIYKGQGIEYAINVKTNTYCQFRFDADKWRKSYNSFINNIRLIDNNLVSYVVNNDANGWTNYIKNKFSNLKSNNVRTLYGWWTIISNLTDIVNTYNKYEKNIAGNNGSSESATLTVTTKENNKAVNISSKFNNETKSSNPSKVVFNTYNLGLKGVANPSSFDMDVVSEVKLTPQNTCVNNYSGDVQAMNATGKCSDGNIVGGNKVYIGYNTDSNTYNISIRVEGLGLNNSSIVNDKCDIKVLGDDLLYRSIDLKNPFINSSWKKGENWANSAYDFTNTIHANTWSESTRNTISISAKDITEIKNSNYSYEKSNYSPYLGICDAVNKKTAIDNKICNAIK